MTLPKLEYDILNDSKILDDINNAFIKKFKTDKNFYIYDVNTNEMLRVDEIIWHTFPEEYGKKPINILDLINKYGEERLKSSLLEIKNEMRSNSLFRRNVPLIKYTATIEELKKHIDGYNKHTCLNVTEKCNLRCRYCVYSGIYKGVRKHSNKQMTWEIAKTAMDDFLLNSRFVENPALNFYGGEPLLNIELIKKCFAYLKKRGKKCRHQLTTNGTLLNKSNIKFLVDNDFTISVSLNGPKKIHDSYRVTADGSGSYDDIFKNIHYIKTNFPNYYEKKVAFTCVFTPPYAFKEVIDYFNSDFFMTNSITFSSVDLEGTDYFNKNFTHDILYIQPTKQIELIEAEYIHCFCDNNSFFKILDLMQSVVGKDLITFYKRDTNSLGPYYIVQGPCLMGQHRIFVNTDGFYYPCERVRNSINIGNIYQGLKYDIIYKYLSDFTNMYSSLCYGCVYIRLCKKCFRDHLVGDAIDENKSREVCINNRNRITHLLNLYFKILEKNPDSFIKFREIGVS